MRGTLERYVIPTLHDTSPLVRIAVNFVMSEELENEMVRAARARSLSDGHSQSHRRHARMGVRLTEVTTLRAAKRDWDDKLTGWFRHRELGFGEDEPNV